MLGMSVITVHSPFRFGFKHTQTHTIAHKRRASSTSQARAQWPVRGTAAGGRFKVMSNDLPEDSEPEAPSLTVVTHHTSFSSCLNFIKTFSFLTSSVSQHLCVCSDRDLSYNEIEDLPSFQGCVRLQDM